MAALGNLAPTPLYTHIRLLGAGFKAAGDAGALVRLGAQYGLKVSIVDLVSLEAAADSGGSSDPASARASGSDGVGMSGTGTAAGNSSSGVAGASSSNDSNQASKAVADETRVSSSRVSAMCRRRHTSASKH